MKIIDGNKIAEDIRDDLRKKGVPDKFFAAVLAGNDPASEKFVARKKKFSESVGVEFKLFRVSTVQETKTTINYLADDEECGGIMVQLPLPESFSKDEILKLIPARKDADALTASSVVLPPAVLAVEEILKRENLDLRNSVAAVVGYGALVGKPVSGWLNGRCKKTVVLRSKDDKGILKVADIIISGAGAKGIITPGMLKEEAVFIDFGCAFSEDGKICGDFDPKGAEKTEIAYTPTPGGTGPILIAKLFENFYELNKEKN